ncbi:MAG: hypothetical protein J5615_00365 [Fibrobacter sp.]|nr:hypothetical protein [Fibrobacter sp.]
MYKVLDIFTCDENHIGAHMKEKCEETLPMIGKFRLVAAFVFALACVCMWGCGLFDEETTTAVDDVRTGGTMVAILDDSLAILKNSRGWEEHAESCDYNETCDKGTMNHGIFLVNYRSKQLPYWGDTAKGIYHIMNGLAYDSTIFFYNDENKFGFWKIRESIDVRGEMKWSKDCNGGKNIQNVRPWEKGNVLLEGAQNCPFAVLDTATGVVSKLEFIGEYAWLDGCDDITYIDGDVVCLRQRGDRLCEIDFEKKDGIVDSLIKGEWMLFDPPEFFGNAVKMKASSFDKNDHAYDFGDRLALIEKNGFDFESYPETWLKYNSFVDSTGSSISYSSEDLIVTK